MNFLFALLIVFLGFALGFLINYLCDVLPHTRRFSAPTCPECGKTRKPIDYLLLKKCDNCGREASKRSLIVLILTLLLTIFLWFFPPHHLNIWLAYLCLVFLAVVAVIDIEYRVVLNQVAITGAFLGLIVGYSINGIVKTLIGGAAGFLIMLGLYFLGEIFARYMSKKRGLDSEEVALGFGDVNLAGILGLMLGWPVIFACLLFAILLGGLISAAMVIGMLVKKDYRPFTAIPYAPFLILSTSVLLYLLK